tara:strand:+ start:479 stop:1372 length:894 start_codon:yes stop_codon:yes gene_type:complete
MKKEKIRVYFADFWPNFNYSDNYFFHLLKTRYEVKVTQENPDILFFSVDYSNKGENLNFNNSETKKIFYTGENMQPDFDNCDAAFSFNPVFDKNNFRLPLWVMFLNWFDVPYNKVRDHSYLLNIEKIKNKKLKMNSDFCSFIASKPIGKRMEFVPLLNSKKQVSCAGELFNNTKKIKGRGDQKWKIKYLKKFKFNLALENSLSPGYVTEKIIHSMYANSIPIYWGDDEAKKDFNSDSFININDYENDEEAVEDIIKIHENKDRYMDILSESWFVNNEIPKKYQPHNVLNFIDSVLNK